MNFTLITSSKQALDSINNISEDYLKRISRFGKMQHINIKPSSKSNTRIRQTEDTQRMLDKVPNQALIIYLDERGRSMGSVQFAKLIEQSFCQHPHLCFMIGPAVGFDRALLSEYRSIRLSDMTLQHEHAQMLLLEQIYRALTILQNHPYHL
jgi:23S rRNA (pseudouridine1915-N3)-methyltransferase